MNDFNALVGKIIAAVGELARHEWLADEYLSRLQNAPNKAETHLLVAEFEGRLHSREILFDTSDAEIHRLGAEYSSLAKQFYALVTYDLRPEDQAQKSKWLAAIKCSAWGMEPEWAFYRSDRCLRFGLLFCRLDGNRLDPGRVWNELCGYKGDALSAELALSPAQSADVAKRLSDLMRV